MRPALSTAWLVGLSAAVLAACTAAPPDPSARAEALLAEGKPEEAALAFELVCAFTPEGDRCARAEQRAAELRVEIAEKDLRNKHFADAERALLRALSTASEAERARIHERLAQRELVLGLRWERARERRDLGERYELAKEIAASDTPIAEEARAFLARETPKILIDAVRAACGPSPRGSCTRARAALEAASLGGPEVEEARALAASEARRVAPLRARAEELLQRFAAEGRRQKVLERCLNARLDETPDHGQLRDTCEEEAYGDDPPAETYRRRRSNEAVFRRTLRAIADPAITDPLRDRRAKALAEGTLARLDLPPLPPLAPEPRAP